jgi:hypothetical protein
VVAFTIFDHELVASGGFEIAGFEPSALAKFDGTTWQAVQGPGSYALTVFADRLIVDLHGTLREWVEGDGRTPRDRALRLGWARHAQSSQPPHCGRETTAHSACVGFGLERCALALLKVHGLHTSSWPVSVRSALSP